MENEDAQLTKEFDNQLEFFPGSLNLFSQVFRNNSVSQIKSFEEVLMRSNPFVESTKPVAKKKGNEAVPEKMKEIILSLTKNKVRIVLYLILM